MKPNHLLLPALFLLCLGAGNILVGTFKARQYQQVYDELMVLRPSTSTGYAATGLSEDELMVDQSSAALSSTLSRIQAVNKTPDRRLQRLLEAKERRNLYQLVTFGGKVIVLIGLLLFCIGSVIRYAKLLELRLLTRKEKQTST